MQNGGRVACRGHVCQGGSDTGYSATTYPLKPLDPAAIVTNFGVTPLIWLEQDGAHTFSYNRGNGAAFGNNCTSAMAWMCNGSNVLNPKGAAQVRTTPFAGNGPPAHTVLSRWECSNDRLTNIGTITAGTYSLGATSIPLTTTPTLTAPTYYPGSGAMA